MQLKNNQTRNRQFYFMRKEGKKGEELVVQDFIHIPGLATVELPDEVFEQLCRVPTTVEVYKRVETELTEDNIGADIKHDKKPLTVVDFQTTGERKTVNLVREAIKAGELEVVEGVARTIDQIAKFLSGMGIDTAKMDEAQQRALYNKLA